MSNGSVEISPVCVKSPALISAPSVETMIATVPTTLLRERTQLYNAKAMRWYLNRQTELSPKDKAVLNRIYDNTKNINEVNTHYNVSGWAGDIGFGRVYSQLGYETLSRKIRANLCAEHYWDVDIENAQPVILLQYAQRLGIDTPALKHYCGHRDATLTLIGSKMETDRSGAKNAVLASLFGGGVACDELKGLKRDAVALTTALMAKPEWADLVTGAQANKPDNVKGSFLATIAQTLERHCCEAMDNFFTERGRSVDTLAYDGQMIRKEEDEAEMPVSLLRDAEVYVSEMTGFNVVLTVKPMVCSIPQAELDAIKIITPTEQRWALVREGTPSCLAELYSIVKEGEVIYSPSLKNYFIYNRITGLWQNNCATDINNDFVRTMTKLLRELIAGLPVPTDATAEKTRVEVEGKLKSATTALKFIASKGVSVVSSFLPTYCMTDFEPVAVFNQSDDLYPLQNGVYSFSQRRLLTYKKEYYFTFKVPINYNSDADTSDIETAMGQWFMGNKPVIDFMQYYLGYSLTPETKRQDFLTVWGETAGNGKSTLFGDLFPLLLTGVRGDVSRSFSHTLNIKDLLVSSSANSDSTYNLAGKRYAIMSEPKLDGKNKLDGEMLKRLTGDSSYSVCAKYKGEITFTPKAKIVILCNKMFKVDVEDEGQLRRLLVAEMNAKFVSKAVYDASSEADKASGRIQLRDDTIIDRLKGNLEGVLKYFLDGASAYVADRFREPPPELFASKLKAVKDLDDLARWIKGYLIKTDVATDFLTMRDIKAEWRTASVSFLPTIREKGFNTQFFNKCKRLGYEVSWNEDRSDEGKVMGVRLFDPSLDDASAVANGGCGGSPAGGDDE